MDHFIYDGGRIGTMGASLKLAGKTNQLATKFSETIRFCTVISRLSSEVGRSYGYSSKKRAPLETADAWIAATAALYNAPLITHNANDYLGLPRLELITEARSN